MKMRCAILLLLVGGLTTSTRVDAQSPPAAPGELLQAPQGQGQPLPANPGNPGVPPGANAQAPGYGQPATGGAGYPGGNPYVMMQPGGQPPAFLPGGLPPGPFYQPGPTPVATTAPLAPDLVPTAPTGPLMFFVNAEYLLWFLKRDNLPALVTQGDANQSQFIDATGIPGALGVPGTVVLDQHLNGDTSHSGVRLKVGAWLDTEQTLGIQGSYFFLFQAGPKTSYTGDGSSSTVISRPFFNVATGLQDASEVYGPGVSGALSITNPSSMMGGDVNVVYNYSTSSLSGIRLAWLIGARYLALDEKLVINQTSDYLPDATGVGAQTYVINDNFTTYNRFYGGQVGGQIESLLGPLYVQILATCALGQTNETVHISGMTTQTNPPDPNLGLPAVVTSASGLLAQPSNVGKYTRNTLSLVPEAQLNIGYSFNENFMLKLGYNLIVWTNVARPGTSISTSLNQQPLGDPVPVQPALPQFNFHSSTFWAQGFQVGFQWTF